MHADIIPLIVGILIFVFSLISLKVGISVAVIEIIPGAVSANLGPRAEEWMSYLAGFGGIVLTFLVGLVICSAVIPTFVAQKWFPPAYSENLVEWNNGR